MNATHGLMSSTPRAGSKSDTCVTYPRWTRARSRFRRACTARQTAAVVRKRFSRWCLPGSRIFIRQCFIPTHFMAAHLSRDVIICVGTESEFEYSSCTDPCSNRTVWCGNPTLHARIQEENEGRDGTVRCTGWEIQACEQQDTRIHPSRYAEQKETHGVMHRHLSMFPTAFTSLCRFSRLVSSLAPGPSESQPREECPDPPVPPYHYLYHLSFHPPFSPYASNRHRFRNRKPSNLAAAATLDTPKRQRHACAPPYLISEGPRVATEPVVVGERRGVALGRHGDALVVEELCRDAAHSRGVDCVDARKHLGEREATAIVEHLAANVLAHLHTSKQNTAQTRQRSTRVLSCSSLRIGRKHAILAPNGLRRRIPARATNRADRQSWT